MAEVVSYDITGKAVTQVVDIPNPPAHIYCDTCGDCIVCEPHGSEEWCNTGGRWVLYADLVDDAVILLGAGRYPP